MTDLAKLLTGIGVRLIYLSIRDHMDLAKVRAPQKKYKLFSWGGFAPPDPPLESAAVAASAGQLRTLKPSRLLSQPPPATVGRQAAAIAAFEVHRGLGAEPPECRGSGGCSPPAKKVKKYARAALG